MADYIHELYKKCYENHIDMLESNIDIDLNKKRSEIVAYLPEDMANDFWKVLVYDSISSFHHGFLAAITPAMQIVMKK